MTSSRLAEVKELIQTAYQQHAEVDRELDGARTAKVDAEASFESWNSGFFLKRVRPNRFVFLKEQADTEAARVEELEQQLQLSKISTHIDIDDQQAELFYQMRDAFAGLSECAAIWDVKTKQATDRFHERTTANERISREHVRFNLGDCDLISWTQKVPHLANAKGGDLYMYPGFILYRAAKQAFSLIDYHDDGITAGLIQFQEEDKVPSDSQIVGQAWFKANKDGSRDKRFNGNYQIPIARYGALCMKSGNGLLGRVPPEQSRQDVPFHRFAEAVYAVIRRRSRYGLNGSSRRRERIVSHEHDQASGALNHPRNHRLGDPGRTPV